MKECDNSTRKIHISSNFILSISLLIMFDTLLLRPSLHYNTPLHFTNYTSLHLVGKLQGKRPIESPGCRWEDNIETYLKEIIREARIRLRIGGQWPVCCEQGSELQGYVEGG